MILLRLLTFVFYGYTYTSYGSRYCRAEGATPQSLSRAASVLFVLFPGCATAREGLFPLVPPSVSLCQASPATKASCPRRLAQDCLHGQTAIVAGPPTPPLCRPHSTLVKRHCQSCPDPDARSRTEAWLTGGQSGGCVPCSWNISSIAYSTLSSSKPTKSWSPTNDGPPTHPRR
jgi:hypothetical protein